MWRTVNGFAPGISIWEGRTAVGARRRAGLTARPQPTSGLGLHRPTVSTHGRGLPLEGVWPGCSERVMNHLPSSWGIIRQTLRGLWVAEEEKQGPPGLPSSAVCRLCSLEKSSSHSDLQLPGLQGGGSGNGGIRGDGGVKERGHMQTRSAGGSRTSLGPTVHAGARLRPGSVAEGCASGGMESLPPSLETSRGCRDGPQGGGHWAPSPHCEVHGGGALG